MTRNNNTLTPGGTGDRLFAACEAEKGILRRLSDVFEESGYRQVRTPGLEFLSVFSSAASYFPPEEMFKMSDAGGRLIAVRPDNTIPIARLTATRLRGAELPLRIYYTQSVFRRQPENRGRDSEVLQAGVEFIGEAGFAADVDMIALAVRSLSETYAGRFRIEIGHVGLYKYLIERLGASEDDLGRIHRYVVSKNYASLGEVLDGYDGSDAAALLRKLPGLFGGAEVLDEAAAAFADAGADVRGMLDYLKQVVDALAARGLAGAVMIDLGLVNQAEYYSSLVFRGYGESAGEPLLSGGRYDGLFADFGEDLPATGFGVNVDLLTEAALGGGGRLQAAPTPPVATVRNLGAAALGRPLRIALTKGRLEKDFTALLERAGYDAAPLKEMGRRLLVQLSAPEGGDAPGIEVFLAKAADVVTYVDHGVCDIGIVGKDTMLEHGGTYYEIMDLGFGKCRFVFAAPEGGRVLRGEAPAVVASKYPNYAARVFERKGLDVRIIKIDGSVEIAPLLGLCDGIVDIVETGTTLAENGLVACETIRDISARLIVNVTGMKLRKREVEGFAARLRGV
ncbi:MAG: ATP phosphoribosyltransferase regulatory subunit [Clostridiales Family XIII bacterium]|jgi:ATP phosphoribosyltransferase regulatory subunit|nr:ATP phosphoribosyltransferase regulatory subunit [Clostridiales Family XIII bacterium]